ncbi:MAG: hypothetical protein J5I50_06400 [Chitinophagaceae bacterium]|nr:hypothetical protein [Chitinophagaceae bacterium]
MKELEFSASGKLLLFGEYLVLRDSLALAVPLTAGQTLRVTPIPDMGVLWQAYEFGQLWFEAHFSNNLDILHTTDKEKATIAQQFLMLLRESRWSDYKDKRLRFDMDFNRRFGFGTSSTLTSLISQWAGDDPYQLMEKIFGGSGYDIAAATATGPFIYSQEKKIEGYYSLSPSVTDNLLFVYLGKKQISSGEVTAFKEKRTTTAQIEEMNSIVTAASKCDVIEEWEQLMDQSERLLSQILGSPTAKDQFFSDYPYAIKSLGAWGGDFIMASCRNIEEAKKYFQDKQKEPIFTYNELAK